MRSCYRSKEETLADLEPRGTITLFSTYLTFLLLKVSGKNKYFCRRKIVEACHVANVTMFCLIASKLNPCLEKTFPRRGLPRLSQNQEIKRKIIVAKGGHLN